MWQLGLGDIDETLKRALLEDLASCDVTSQATVPAEATARARMLAKSPLVLAGLPIAHRCFTLVDAQLGFSASADDGEKLPSGAEIAVIYGNARSLLAAERTALNFVQRLSGTATLTRAFVDAATPEHSVHPGCRITDTRKTTPGMRAFERYAVRCGGGHNHRNDLGAAVLIKENHIRCAGGIGAAIRAAKAFAPHTTQIECEVTNLDELQEALGAEADIVMLDNMNDTQITQAVQLVDGRALIEVSGGITLERLPKLAAMGVDLVSVGALTHSAPAADISLLIDIEG